MQVRDEVATSAAAAFERHAGSPFLIDAIDGRAFSYREVDELAGGLAAALVERGAGPGSRIGLVLPNSAELAILYFACLRLGVTAVPLGPATPERERARALAHTRATAVLTEVEGLLDAARGRSFAAPAPDPDALLTISFTSGTTATPKGVAHRARVLLGAAAAFAEELELGAGDRFLHTLPMTYMAGFLNTLLVPFVAGASVVLAPAFDNATLLRYWKPVVRHGVTRLWVTPTIVAALLRLDRDPAGPEYARQRIQSVSSATAPLPPRHAAAFEERYGTPVYDSYGLSELTFVAARSPRAGAADGSVGRLLRGVEAEERDGELFVRSPFAMAGYLGEEGEPDPATSPEWFPTGDLGHVDAERRLFVTGRKKDVIIRGGLNVSPRAVEDVLAAHEAVAEAAVVGVPHELLGEDVVGAVVLAQGRSLDAERETLLALCRERLPAGSVPGQLVALDAFPRNETGKVRKDALRELVQAR